VSGWTSDPQVCRFDFVVDGPLLTGPSFPQTHPAKGNRIDHLRVPPKDVDLTVGDMYPWVLSIEVRGTNSPTPICKRWAGFSELSICSDGIQFPLEQDCTQDQWRQRCVRRFDGGPSGMIFCTPSGICCNVIDRLLLQVFGKRVAASQSGVSTSNRDFDPSGGRFSTGVPGPRLKSILGHLQWYEVTHACTPRASTCAHPSRPVPIPS